MKFGWKRGKCNFKKAATVRNTRARGKCRSFLEKEHLHPFVSVRVSASELSTDFETIGAELGQ